MTMNAYFTFRKLSPAAEKNLEATFQHMADLLEGSAEPARIQFQILEGDKKSVWLLDLGPTSCRLSTEKDERPDFEIITTADTWWNLAEGSLSPFRAFTQGKLRVLGDIDLGRRVLQGLAEPT
jgi:putative sterol carrier protein